MERTAYGNIIPGGKPAQLVNPFSKEANLMDFEGDQLLEDNLGLNLPTLSNLINLASCTAADDRLFKYSKIERFIMQEIERRIKSMTHEVTKELALSREDCS